MISSNSDDFSTHKRNLPHIYIPDQPIFITWKLEQSLSENLQKQITELRTDLELLGKELSKTRLKQDQYNHHKKVFEIIDNELAVRHIHPFKLTEPRIADILTTVIHQGENYILHAYSVMSNHIHILITPICSKGNFQKEVSNIIRRWKDVSSRKINQL